MIRLLIGAVALLLLAGCQGMQSASDIGLTLGELGTEMATVQGTLAAMSEKDTVDANDLLALQAGLDSVAGSVETVFDTVSELPAALEKDKTDAANFVSDLSNGEAAGGLVGVLGMAGWLLNRHRDGKRRKRGEPTGTDTPSGVT